ncbi:S-layer homology domain-containing protein [Salibacterium salarium]|uniref:S-layer homology domain-containing protein n=1 Tax=Salibacterium salarium TaxID=284579 RepID=UPI00115FF3A4|nr:S-layer homology domain-containing protein [Salibacterium salarium]
MGENLPFDDADAISNKGVVDIAIQLGIVGNEENEFSPKAKAATSIMKLVELQGNIDQ